MRLGRTPQPAAIGPQPLALCASEGGIKIGKANFVSRGDQSPLDGMSSGTAEEEEGHGAGARVGADDGADMVQNHMLYAKATL